MSIKCKFEKYFPKKLPTEFFFIIALRQRDFLFLANLEEYPIFYFFYFINLNPISGITICCST